MGRLARPLTAFLDPTKGRYEGFDIDASNVRWCSRHYVSHPNFHFQRANIYNKMYNPKATVQAQAFTFPYPDASFDFAFASSVFTHMPLPAVAHYLEETARVLAPGARALLTLYIWNPESQASVAQGKSALPFRPHSDLIVINPVIPEAAIALLQEGWDQAVRDAGLRLICCASPTPTASWRHARRRCPRRLQSRSNASQKPTADGLPRLHVRCRSGTPVMLRQCQF